MRFDGEMDRRLINWARWKLQREQGGNIATGSMAERVDCSGWDAPTVIPLLYAEAEETQAMVAKLDGVHRDAVEVWYCHPGGVATRCAKVSASETVVRGRVAQAHRSIGQWLQDKREAAQQERSRVEQLRRGVLLSVGNP